MDERDIVRLYAGPTRVSPATGSSMVRIHAASGRSPACSAATSASSACLTLEEAIRKMTSLSAANVGIVGRGSIRAGMAADLVLFDPQMVAESATMANPHLPSVGIHSVWVNGTVVYENGKTTGRFPGRVLHRPSLDDRIEASVREEMARQRIPGLAVGIIHKDRVSARGYGYANIEHLVPVTDETVFQSGSLGKMFTAAAVMLQVEDGKLALSNRITTFFPNAPDSWKGITVSHLLTHTSGIPDYTTSAFDYRRDYTEEELARLAFAQKLEFPPGSRWNYSNTGYALLGFIVRKVSGSSTATSSPNGFSGRSE